MMEWVGGDVTGILPYSRMTTPPGDTVVEELTEALRIPRDDLPALIRNCYEVTAILVHVMTDRARRFTSTDLRDEKLISLGKLASGLAHELNNPASAAMRDAKSLADALGAARRGGAQSCRGGTYLRTAEGTGRGARPSPDFSHPSRPCPDSRSPTGRRPSRNGSTTMTSTASPRRNWPEQPSRLEVLDRLARMLQGESLGAALRWIAGGASARSLAHDIERAVTRIHALVASVKGFTHMDRAPVPEPVDISRGLDDTVAMLDGKARGKSVAITLTIAPDLPPSAVSASKSIRSG